jgi:anti-sigma regulatory factor (Ser/Thr protein kinase)
VDDSALAWESGATERHASRVFSSDTVEVVRARRMVQAHLRAWGYDDDVDAVTLAVSELVTNAVVHGRGPVELTLTAGDGAIRVAVTDQGGGRPRLVQAGTGMHSGGWGLRLVDELADEWASVQEGSRTSVWMQRRAAARGRDEPNRHPT